MTIEIKNPEITTDGDTTYIHDGDACLVIREGVYQGWYKPNGND